MRLIGNRAQDDGADEPKEPEGPEHETVVLDLDEDVLYLQFGEPGRCPACHGPGHLLHIDVRRRCSYHDCQDCGHTWWVSEAYPGQAFDEPVTI